MENTYTLVLTTVANEEEATSLAHSIISSGLGACVQIQSIRSVCRWKGELCAGPECLLMIKTTDIKYPELEQHIKASHSYETPEIIKIPISGGSREYLGWIDQCVQ
jgi:periplasmic divalent cation tolerance protein